LKSHASKIVVRVDDELELGRLHDRQVGGLDAFDDLARGDRLGAPGDFPRADNGGRSAPRATGKKCAIICSLAKP
jgi:hypothetical protein